MFQPLLSFLLACLLRLWRIAIANTLDDYEHVVVAVVVVTVDCYCCFTPIVLHIASSYFLRSSILPLHSRPHFFSTIPSYCLSF